MLFKQVCVVYITDRVLNLGSTFSPFSFRLFSGLMCFGKTTHVCPMRDHVGGIHFRIMGRGGHSCPLTSSSIGMQTACITFISMYLSCTCFRFDDYCIFKSGQYDLSRTCPVRHFLLGKNLLVFI